MVGGSGDFSAVVETDQSAGKVSIGGSVIGGSGYGSAFFLLPQGAESLDIAGSLLGGSGNASAFVQSLGHPLGLLRIGGDVRGGSGEGSAAVSAGATKLVIRGNIIPGTGPGSGKIG